MGRFIFGLLKININKKLWGVLIANSSDICDNNKDFIWGIKFWIYYLLILQFYFFS
jgi:hypothetical protein